ncbi:MAG: hypothetical protein KY453_00185 [Gemmatimonadetes bacterium]|nr:hypothetical protein [Gemmatimonadota bacterium]
MNPPPSSHIPTPRPDETLAPRRPSAGPLVVGLVISAAIHLLVLALYPVMAPRPDEIEGPTFSESGQRTLQGTELLRIVELPPEPEPEEPEEPELLEEREEPAPRSAPVPAPVGTPGDPEGEEAVPTDEELMSAAERLRPRAGDLRLWAPLPENLAALSDEQRRKLDFALALAAVADSMEAAAEAARRATDWTFTDTDGKRWGVSPGKIHLGDVTLPLPFTFAAPFDPSNDGGWQWEDLERGAASAAARESAKARGEAIRERVDRERERLRGGPVRPDTSGVGG